MSNAPRVSVVMPVFDGARFLDEAIESVLAQTLSDFELLVVDDGSSDGSAEIAARHAAADARVRLVSQPHRGLPWALNLGFEEARGEYIARADADDVNLPQRLARQVAALDAMPEVGICGSWITRLDTGAVWPLASEGAWLRSLVLFETPFQHPTVMLRRRWLLQTGCRYDPAFEHAEDYDLWERLADLTEFHNFPAALVRYRVHAAQVSKRHERAQLEAVRRVRERAIARLGVRAGAEELRLHDAIAAHGPFARGDLVAARAWLENLEQANRRCGRFPAAAFAAVLALRYASVCARLPQASWRCAGEMAKSRAVRAHPEIWARAAQLLLRKHPRLVRALRPLARQISSTAQR